MVVRIRKGMYKGYPYLDTLKYFNPAGTMSNKFTSGSYLLESTDGDIYQCEDCDGSGRQDCGNCDGDGAWECDECNGRGTITDDDNDECSKCDGSGRVVCDNCDGDGIVDCYECQ
jgi:hypothetical protein